MDEKISELKDDKLYNRIKLRLTAADLLKDILLISILAFSGISNYAADLASLWNNQYLDFLTFIMLLGVVFSSIGIPLDYYGSYVVEHRFGLSNQSFLRWVGEKGKSTLVGFVIMLPLSLLFYFFLKSAGELWWLYFSIVLFTFSVLLAKIAPVIIMPLFYTFTEIEEGEVKERIRAVTDNAGIGIKGIFKFDMSKNTKKANAGFTGLGSSKRIILSDTLLDDFTPGEIAIVFAHEAGHYNKKHILKNLVLSTVIIFLTFYLCSLFYSASISSMGFTEIYDLGALPVLLFYLTVSGLVMMPLTNYISRRYEVEADTSALELTGDRESFISAMEKLADINLADRDPSPIVEFFLYSHPSIKKRIEFAGKF